MKRVLFIGLGNMGLPMALNLLKSGLEVVGFDLSPAAVSQLVEAGGRSAASLDAAIMSAEAVVTMLPSGKLVADVLWEKEGLLKKAARGTLFIDCSTIEAETAQKMALFAREVEQDFLDAPVSGGTAGAAQGTLTFMVGGEVSALERASALLSPMGKAIFHAGSAGAGQIAKACNNMLLATHMVGTAEALNLGVKLGLDPKVLSEIMLKSSGSNWSLSNYNPYPGVLPNVPASRDYAGGFAVELMNKDLGLALESAAKAKVAVPMGQTAYVLYKTHGRTGGKRLDFSSIIRFLGDEG